MSHYDASSLSRIISRASVRLWRRRSRFVLSGEGLAQSYCAVSRAQWLTHLAEGVVHLSPSERNVL